MIISYFHFDAIQKDKMLDEMLTNLTAYDSEKFNILKKKNSFKKSKLWENQGSYLVLV